jgi:hypothetical protein
MHIVLGTLNIKIVQLMSECPVSGSPLLVPAVTSDGCAACKLRCCTCTAATAAALPADDQASSSSGSLGDLGFKAFVTEAEWRRIDRKVRSCSRLPAVAGASTAQ